MDKKYDITSRSGMKLKRLEHSLLSTCDYLDDGFAKLKRTLEAFPDSVTVDRGDIIPRLAHEADLIIEDALRDLEKLK